MPFFVGVPDGARFKGMMKMKEKVLIAGVPEEVENYVEALKNAGLQPVVALQLPTKDGLTAEDFAGLLLPGGGDVDPSFFGQENCGSRTIEKELDIAQLNMTDLFVKAKKPILGICKGCQVINIYFKGDIIQDLENNVHHQAYEGKAVKHKATTLENNIFYELFGSDEMVINSSHHQAIDRLGKDLRVCQYSDDHVIEAIQHETLPVLGTQWHPERMAYSKHIAGEADGTLIFEAYKKLIESNHSNQ